MELGLEGVCRVVGGETHLDGISLELEAGRPNVVLGRTGAGKTSLLRVIAGLDRASAGRISVDGRDVTRFGVRGRRVAFVYQQFVNYPSFTVYRNIASPLEVAGGLSKEEIERRVREVAALLHLEPFLGRLPAELSGGQQQRTAIARALVKDSDLLLLDEPLANLDYKLREELRAELREIFRTRRGIVVYATAEPQEALLLGGNLSVLHEGRLLENGAAEALYRRPPSELVARLFGDPEMNVFDGEIAGSRVRLSAAVELELPGHLASLSAGRVRFGIRPGHFTLSARSPADIRIPAEVELAEVSGSETLLHARHGDLPLVAQEDGVARHVPGESVDLFLDARRLFAFDPESGRLQAAPGDR